MGLPHCDEFNNLKYHYSYKPPIHRVGFKPYPMDWGLSAQSTHKFSSFRRNSVVVREAL